MIYAFAGKNKLSQNNMGRKSIRKKGEHLLLNWWRYLMSYSATYNIVRLLVIEWINTNVMSLITN